MQGVWAWEVDEIKGREFRMSSRAKIRLWGYDVLWGYVRVHWTVQR